MKNPIILFIWLSLVPALQLSAATIHVPDDQPTIQAGIDAAVDGDMVLVADGTYTGPGNFNIDFQGKAVTVRSVNGYGACTIDCQGGAGQYRNAFRLTSGEGPGSVIQGFTIRGGYFGGDGGAIHALGSSPQILDNSFIHNLSWGNGGAIHCGASTLIKGNKFYQNFAVFSWGGALNIESGSVLVENNSIVDNTADWGGAGIACWGGTPTIVNNMIRDNVQYEYDDEDPNYGGAGIALYGGCAAELTSCTLVDNFAEQLGGGILVAGTSTLACSNSVLWNNTGGLSSGDDIEYHSGATVLVEYTNIEDGWAGTGNLSLDPLFIEGPSGRYYLQQKAAGQPVTSPSVDAGDPLSDPADGTTRTDYLPDQDVVDMGYHYPPYTRTVDAGISCIPGSGTVPFTSQIEVTLQNLYIGQSRRMAARIDVKTTGELIFTNWRAGHSTISAGEQYSTSWIQYIPDIASLIGSIRLRLICEDVTPAPFNQPPHPASGGTDVDNCWITVNRP